MLTRLFMASALFALTAYAVADSNKPGAKTGLEGVWVVQRAVKDGKAIHDNEAVGSQLIVTGDRLIAVDKQKKHLYEMTYKLNTARSPKEIDMKMVEGPEKGKSAEGIYSLEGDTLRICYPYAGGKRPKEFTSKEGDMLLELKRDQSKK